MLRRRIFKRLECPFASIRNRGVIGSRRLGNGIRRERNLPYIPEATIFKPNGIPQFDLNIVKLGLDEWEAMRLKYVDDINQMEASEKMGISQSTFARILDSANKKIANAIVNGCAIEIIKN